MASQTTEYWQTVVGSIELAHKVQELAQDQELLSPGSMSRHTLKAEEIGYY